MPDSFEPVAARAEGETLSVYLDVSADGALSPLDALLVINELNRQSDAEAEPEPLAAVAAAVHSLEAPSVDAGSERLADLVLPLDLDDSRRMIRDAAAHELLFAAIAVGDDRWMTTAKARRVSEG